MIYWRAVESYTRLDGTRQGKPLAALARSLFSFDREPPFSSLLEHRKEGAGNPYTRIVASALCASDTDFWC